MYTPKGQEPQALQTIQRFEVVDCIDSKHVPAVIPNASGPWVRYEDHAAQVAALTAAQAGVPAGFVAKVEAAHRAVHPAAKAALIEEAVELLAAAPQPSPSPAPAQPIDMVLHCPACNLQHIDAPDERTPDWKNEPHRSHLCHGCGYIWRPADVPTNGVHAIKTKGKADSPIAAPAPAPAAQQGDA